ncbi:MAG: TerD family protein [Bacteroidetes bacterium]|nr:MAG: TerD family protein [Bacteroidota bacterium]
MAINLKKGSKINLSKPDGSPLEFVGVGLNWGAIKKKSFFGLLENQESVDLDGSAAIFDKNKKLIEVVYFKNLLSKDKAVKHSGDDLRGDLYGNDNRDNEIITIDLLKITPIATDIVFFLNSYKKQDFADIPYSTINIYSTRADEPMHQDKILATFDLSSDKGYAGYISMVMGKLSKKEDGWHFEAIGEPNTTTRVFDTVDYIQTKYL